MSQVKSESPNNPDLKEAFGAAILASLKSYGLRHTQCEDGSNYPLVDALTPPDEQKISLGQDELRLLADHLYNELETAFSAMVEQKTVQSSKDVASPKDVRDVVSAARAVTTWLDWSGGLPTMNGLHMSKDVIALGKAVNEFDSCEVLRANFDVEQHQTEILRKTLPVLSHEGVIVLPQRRKVSQDSGDGREWNAAIDELIRLNPNKPNTVKVMRWLPRNPTVSMSEAGRHACGYLGFCASGDAAQYIWNQMVEAFEKQKE